MSFSNIKVAQIVAHDRNRAIGKNNQLPWHISEDLQHFKRLTENSIVIMGRKTFESMGAKPLPNRTNFVITTDLAYQTDFDNVIIFHNLDDALTQGASLAHGKGLDTIWVIGGQKLFEQSMLFTDRLEITEVDTEVQGADVFYPVMPSDFVKVSASEPKTDGKSGLGFQFITYQRTTT
ncbi:MULTISPECIES: dihydrofolate reductase [unclassified Moraxella]|uniref:dihydrofolate reductase n=1 Tax=unclassified Moraxella TaxID=2685852 RepID=UPI003AF526B1